MHADTWFLILTFAPVAIIMASVGIKKEQEEACNLETKGKPKKIYHLGLTNNNLKF